MISAAAGLALLAPCAWTLLGALVVLLLVAIQSRLEERHLAALHGEAYLAYASRVGRFLPWVGRLARRPALR